MIRVANTTTRGQVVGFRTFYGYHVYERTLGIAFIAFSAMWNTNPLTPLLHSITGVMILGIHISSLEIEDDYQNELNCRHL